MQIPSPRGTKRARIEVIPLIDVIFFLLATFVLFTLTLNKTQGIPVNLPVAKTGENRDTVETVTVTVSEQGGLFWNKEQVSFDEFLIRLVQYRKQEPDPKILINGDEKAMFGSAIVILDEIRKAGVSKVSIETKVRPAGR